MSYSLTLTDARQYVRYFGHNARSTAMYPTTMLDLAIQTATDRVVREAFLLYTTGTMTLNSGTATLGTLPTGCRPDRVIKAYLIGANVTVGWGYDGGTPWAWPWVYGVLGGPWPTFGGWPQQSELTIGDYSQLLNGQYSSGALSSQPTNLAFDSRSGSGMVYPTPPQNYTLTLGWTGLFTQWPAGQPVMNVNVSNSNNVSSVTITFAGDYGRYASAPLLTIAAPPGTGSTATAVAVLGTGTASGTIGSVTITAPGTGYSQTVPPTISIDGNTAANITFNLEDDYLQDILLNAVSPQLQYTEQEHKYLPPGWADKYIDSVVARLRGKGNLGVQSIAVEPRG